MIPIIIVTLSQNSLLKPQIGSDNIGPLPYHFNLRFNFNTYLVNQINKITNMIKLSNQQHLIKQQTGKSFSV